MQYRNDYMHYAHKKTTPIELQQAFHKAAVKKLKGPKLVIDIPFSLKVEPKSPDLPAIERLKNYSIKGIDLKLVDGMTTSSFSPASSQEDIEHEAWFEKVAEDLNKTVSSETNALFS